MTRSTRPAMRFRTVLLAALFVFTTFAVDAAPAEIAPPRPDALGPQPALAAFCASNPSFTGVLTASSASTTAVNRIANPTVYGYISNVNAAWSCTAYYRYSAVAWNTTPTTGTLSWGNLIASVSVACNFVVGSTDYVKANGTTDCPDFDAEYAMAVTLGPEGTYQSDVDHTVTGDWSFAHSDCGTYYGAQAVKTGQGFSGATVGNRPGSNCDPLTLDNGGVAQPIILDWTAPSGSVTAEFGDAYANTTAVTLSLSASDAVAGLDAMRFSNDNVNWGAWQVYATTASWTLSAGDGTKTVYAQFRDLNGNQSGSFTDTIVLDTAAPTLDFSTPNELTTTIQSATSYTVAWSENGTGSPIAVRDLQRYVAPIPAAGSCTGGAFIEDGASSGAASPVNVSGLIGGKCYVWIQILFDAAGNYAVGESGAVLIDTTAGAPSPPDVDATGSGVFQPATNGTVFFRPSAASSIALDAWAVDAESGLAHVRFQTLSGTGWTPTPALPNTDAGAPYTQNLAFSGATSSGSIQVLSRNNASIDSAIRTVTLTADTSAPTADFTSPDEPTTTSQPSDAVAVTWTESDGAGAGVSATSLMRQKATLTDGVCGTFANDPAFTAVPDPASPYGDAGLLVNACYRWGLTLTDQVGNSGTAYSGTIVRDTTANLGRQRQHTFETWDLGAGDTLAVNVANGNALVSHPIVSLPIRGSSASLSLVYNSQDPASVLGPSAPGWRLDVQRRLLVNADGSVTFTAADGARYAFTSPQGSGTITYTRPPALYATLTRDTNATPDRFTLTYRDQSKDIFDELLTNQGLLVREEDRFGNGVSVAYTGGTDRISQITDAAASPARTIDFTWDASNRLTQIADWAYVDGAGVVQTTNSGTRRAYRLFYDGSGRLAGWSDPLNTTGSCPTGGSHLTCIAYPPGGLDISKTQTVTTAGAQALSTTARTITTKVAFAGSNVAAVKDAQQVADGGSGTTFSWETPTRIWVDRPATVPIATAYGLVAQNDPHARIQSVWRDYPEGLVQIERRIVWDGSQPVEPASVTDNYGGLLSTPARTTSYTYVGSSLGLLSKVVEPLTGSTNRWTEYLYNANNDVTQKTVSQDGSGSLRTITRYCYTTQSLTCPATETGLTLVRQIDNWVSAGPQDDDTNVATDYAYDAFGRQTSVTRHNRAPDGSVRDDRVDAFVYDAANKGHLEKTITNYVDGVVTNGMLDTTPGTDSVRTDLTTIHTYDTAGNRVGSADPRRAIGLAIPASTTYTFSPTADAHVRDAFPTTNYGTATTLQARAAGGSEGAYEPNLKFTVTGLVGTVTSAVLRLQNTAASNMAVPSQRVKGALVSSLSALTVAPGSGHLAGDVELLFVETANQPATLSTAAGFAQIPGTGVGVGAAGGTSATRMTVFWRRWNGTDGSPTVADSGDHQAGLMVSYLGVIGAGNPWDVVGSNQQAAATTSGTASGVTTGVANALVVVATAGAQPDANSTTQFSGWTNANLTGLTERHDEAVNTGNGGAIGLTDGLKAVAGATGATTFTTATSAAKDNVVIALKGRAVCAHRVPDTTWTEGGITWNTKPASDVASIACVQGNQAGGPIDFDLGPNVPGPGLWAFRLTNNTTTAVSYGSKEHATLPDPALLVTVSYGPLAADDWITRWTYDALNERLTETTPKTFGLTDQKTATATYDELGAVRHSVDFNGLLTTGTESDRAGRTTKTFEDTDAAGATAPATTSITTYDPDGNVITIKDRNQAANLALGHTRNDYDSLGRLELATDAFASSPDVASDTLTGYDALDRATLLSYGGLDTVSTFDLGGRTLSTDDDFTCSTSTYDYRDLALTTTSGLAGGTCASAANTRTVSHSLDGLGRTYRSEVSAGSGSGDRTTDVTLDSAGNTLSAAARKGGVTTTTTFTVNRLDRTTAEVRPDGSTTKHTFDPAANATERCYWKPAISVGDCLVVGTPAWANPPTQSTSTTYDARNQRIQLVDGLTNGVTTYDPNHTYQPAAVYVPTGSGRELQSLSSYDSRHRLTTITHQLCVLSNVTTHACSSTTPAGSDTYAYDEVDNRTQVTESNGAISSDRRYCYDARDQLAYRNTGAACSSSARDEANTYDDAGNRLTALVGAVTTNFAYTIDGQLCDVETAPTVASCSGGNLTYDTAGRTQTWNGWTFAYDSQGRMTSACKSPTCAAGFDRVEFAYDGEGHRTQTKTTSAAGAVATRDFRYQGSAIVEEQLTDAAHPAPGTVVRSYISDDAGSAVKLIIAAGEPDAGTYLVTWNGHGDALALWRQNSDGTLTLANSYTYTTWGGPTTTAHNGIADLGFRFLYVGEFDVQWDDAFGLGLAYMHARHYSPTLGRFLQPDPDGSEANLYAYTANNPVTELDPSGTCFILCAVLNAAIDTAIYLATTENATLEGAAGAAAVGAVSGFLGVGLLSKVTKIGVVAKALTKVPKAGRLSPIGRLGNQAGHLRLGSVGTAAKRFTPDQDALVQIARGAKRRGPISQQDARILESWRNEYGLKGHRPLFHPRFPQHGLHINIGPIRHIRIGGQ